MIPVCKMNVAVFSSSSLLPQSLVCSWTAVCLALILLLLSAEVAISAEVGISAVYVRLSGLQNQHVTNGCPVTHQTLPQQGGTGEDSYIHLVDWTLSVVETEKKGKPFL